MERNDTPKPEFNRSPELEQTVRSLAEFRKRQLGGEAIARRTHPAKGSASVDETLNRLERKRKGSSHLRLVENEN